MDERNPGDVPQDPPPVIRVTPEEVDRAEPPPPRTMGLQPVMVRPPKGPRWSQMAVLTFILGILGLLLLGLPGLLALITGALALSSLHADETLKGRKLAISGMLFGLVGLAGWSVAGVYLVLGQGGFGRPGSPPTMPEVSGGGPPEGLREAPEPFRSALLANVVITGSSAGMRWSGAGIVIDRATEGLRILTNRHVGIGPGNEDAAVGLQVMLSNGETRTGRTVWRAPDGVDLCIVETEGDVEGEIPVVPLRRRPAGVGHSVFAVGNPLGYQWSLTKGVISSVRDVTVRKRRLKIYQTQTPISHGNSGGGLYLEDGGLVGVNTWTADKSLSEGLGFSISIESALDVLSEAPFEWARRLVSPGPEAEKKK